MEKTKADRDRGQIVNKKELVGQTARFIGMIALIIAVSVVAFTLFYTRYNDRILYAERLSQMQDVTVQLYSGLEDVVGTQWSKVDVLSNYIEVATPRRRGGRASASGSTRWPTNISSATGCACGRSF